MRGSIIFHSQSIQIFLNKEIVSVWLDALGPVAVEL